VRIVVDTNIVFSALLNPSSRLGAILFEFHGRLSFFSPEYLRGELDRYQDKLLKASKLDAQQLNEATIHLMDRIVFVSEDLISSSSWEKAYDLTMDVDENDTPFVALSLEMQAKLWTGDKKLTDGLQRKGWDSFITTLEIIQFLNE
jgi:predicted nucleic acid-binding protein